MITRIDNLITEYMQSIIFEDELDSARVSTLLDQVREAFDIDCLFVFENLTFRNDFVYSYYCTDEHYTSRENEIIQFNDAEYIQRVNKYKYSSVCEEKYLTDENTPEVTLRYGFLTGETFQGSIGFRYFREHIFSEEEIESIKRIGRVIRMYLDCKFRRRVRIERSQRVLRVLEQAYSGLYYIDILNDTIQTINTKQIIFDTKHILKYTDFFKKYYSRLFLEDDKTRFKERFCRKEIANFFANNSLIEDCFCVIEDGKEKWERLRLLLSDTCDEKIYHVVLTIQDITEEHVQVEELNRKIVAASQAKSTFLAQTSHDIRTPLNAIIGYAKIANSRVPQDSVISEYLRKIEKSGNYLTYLINDVLDYTKFELGKITPVYDWVSIKQLVSESFNLFEIQANDKGLSYKLNMNADDSLFVYTDEIRIQQITNNILSNAVKYTNEGSVTLSINMEECNADNVQKRILIIQCEDTGLGMSEEFLKHVFEPYSREENNVHSINGTGLGMSIVKNIVETLDGHMNVQSKQGIGTNIGIKIPVDISNDIEVNRETEDSFEGASDTNTLAGKTVLLVDDNEFNREIGTELLAEKEINVITAANGKEAIEILFSHDPDYFACVLMDIRMPGMNGYETTKLIRKNPEYKDCAIIALSADILNEDERESSLMDDYIIKPVDISKLLKCMSKHKKH